MKSKIDLIARLILGVILLIFGLNTFFPFMPMPELPECAGKLLGAFAESGYIFPMIGVVKIVVGVLLLINRYVALALLLLAPFSVNVILYHLVLDPKGIAAALIVAALNIYLLFAYKKKYDPVLKAKS